MDTAELLRIIIAKKKFMKIFFQLIESWVNNNNNKRPESQRQDNNLSIDSWSNRSKSDADQMDFLISGTRIHYFKGREGVVLKSI